MANRIRKGKGFNKGHGSKFRVGSRVRQTPEEGQKTYRPKQFGNNNSVGEANNLLTASAAQGETPLHTKKIMSRLITSVTLFDGISNFAGYLKSELSL